MKKNGLIPLVLVATVFMSLGAQAEDAYPRSPELIAAQAELDAFKALGSRDALSKEDQKQLDAAIAARNSLLDQRNAEWKAKDSVSMLKVQATVCSDMRQGLDQGRKSTDYFDVLRYAGLSSDETLDVVLQASERTPQVGKGVRVALCILGLPIESVRRESQRSSRSMLVYPRMFVHTEDGVVTSWSDR